MKTETIISLLEKYPGYEFKGWGLRNNTTHLMFLEKDGDKVEIELTNSPKQVQSRDEIINWLSRDDVQEVLEQVYRNYPSFNRTKFEVYAFENLKKKFLGGKDYILRKEVEILADEYYEKRLKLINMPNHDLRCIEYKDCRLCENETVCAVTSVSACRNIQIENII